MASKTIKGLTIEIGADTTKLGKALKDVEAQSRSLSKELGDINKLLKMDPGNADLLAQKQKVLAEAADNTAEKLRILKEAEKQVQAQFEKGEVSEEQLRALQREIVATENKMKGYQKAAKQTADEIDKLGDGSDDAAEEVEDTGEEAKEAAKKVDDFADASKNAGNETTGLSKAAVAAGTALGNFAANILSKVVDGIGNAIEESREYRAEMGKLDSAFTANGHSAETATQTYQTLQGVIGETDQSVEAAQQISLLAKSEEDAAQWANLAAGVVGQFGDALQPETFFEAANETIKLGEATGAFTQMLEGTGMSVEEFNKGLAACTTEEEKQAYMLEVSNQALGAAGERYREVNGEIIRSNEANEMWMQSLAGIGGAVEPIITDIKMLGASMLSDLLPGVQAVADAFRGLLSGDEGAADSLGAAVSGIITDLLGKITDLAPTVVQIGTSLLTTLTSSLLGMLPELVSVGVELLLSLIDGVTQAIPQLVQAIVGAIPQLVQAIQTGLPLLLQGLCDLVVALAGSIEQIVEPLIAALPVLLESITTSLLGLLPELIPQLLDIVVSLVTMLVEQLPVLIPQIVSLCMQIITLLTEQLPVLLPQIIAAAVAIVNLLVEQLPVIIPLLIDACIQIVMALIEALPTILLALTDALPSILQAVWDAIVMVFVNLPEWFGQLFQGAVDIISTTFSALGEFFSGIWTDIREIFAPVGEWFSGVFSKAWSGIKNAWSATGSFFSGIWSGIKNAFGSVGSWFKDTFSKAWQAVKNVFSTGGKVFDGIKDGISNVFKTVVNAIIRGINKVIKVPFDAINGMLKKLKGIEIAGLKPFGFIKTFNVPQIPELAEGGVLKKGQVGFLEGDGDEAVVPLEKNTGWLQEVAERLADRLVTFAPAVAAMDGMAAKLDSILAAIEHGQILTIDGEALVGATVGTMDRTLGQRQILAARGAL